MNKIRRIVLIGPVYPYKGGISHYTGMLCRALGSKYEVVMVSFGMQYPKLLFKKEQKDYANKSFEAADARYWINTANPLNWLRCAGKIKKEEPDLIIFQWWHPYFAPCYRTLAGCLKKYRILFICHNVYPHERFWLDKKLAKMTLRQGDCFIVQSGTDAEDLKGAVKNPLYEQAVHPTYDAFKLTGMPADAARGLLHIREGEKVLLFFGFIREYKGLKYLISAMPAILEKLRDARLFIVGEFGSEEEKNAYMEEICRLGVKDHIEIHDGYIPDKEVEKYFAACDLVVLPYISATQSGIVQIAYGFEKPVVATDVGGLPDVVKNGVTGYVVGAGRADQLADAVVRYFEEDREAEFGLHVKEEAYRFSWDRMVEIIERLSGRI